jgi:dephospho-CoA kinase
VLGVTGAIGAGKSTLCRILRGSGWSVLDVDDVAAAALPEVQPLLVRRIPSVLTAGGALDKARIFSAMLREPDLRTELEEALRPLVQRRVREWKDALSGPGALDAALLFESGLDAFCDATLCLLCPREERRRRVRERSTASAPHFDALEAAQWPESAKQARAGACLSTRDAAEQPDGPQRIERELRQVLISLGWPI